MQDPIKKTLEHRNGDSERSGEDHYRSQSQEDQELGRVTVVTTIITQTSGISVLQTLLYCHTEHHQGLDGATDT